MMSRDRDMVDMERSSRSVFVGNIPYEATEEKLKDIFSEVGPVVSFRLVFDRESGKPKGYGFAEYQDIETAMSAMRNLNNRELLGRALRVDHATSEKNRIMDDLHHIGGHLGPQKESPYGEPVPPKDAPEAISKAVASLPPEQMFELMKQMKQCIQNNPVEARNMLLQNPQLAYALLQAQVVMRIVDPEIAMKMLHRQNLVPTLMPSADAPERPVDRPNGDGRGPPFLESRRMMDEPMDIARRREGSPMDRMDPRGPLPPMRGPPDERRPLDIPMDRGRGEPLGLGPRDGPLGPRDGPMDRGRGRPMGRRSPEPFGRGPFGHPELRHPGFPDRGSEGIPGVGRMPMDRGPPMDRGGPPFHEGRGGPPPRMLDQERGGPMRDNRGTSMERAPPPAGDPRRGPGRPANEASPAGGVPPTGVDPNNPDQEKAALILQVLQLTPEQISMLPEEQRKSILILKEQLTGGRQ